VILSVNLAVLKLMNKFRHQWTAVVSSSVLMVGGSF